MDKLILRKQGKQDNKYYRLRVNGEAYETVERIAEEANISMAEVCSKMVMFAAAHCEVVEDD